jgi:hypothetical protein
VLRWVYTLLHQVQKSMDCAEVGIYFATSGTEKYGLRYRRYRFDKCRYRGLYSFLGPIQSLTGKCRDLYSFLGWQI